MVICKELGMSCSLQTPRLVKYLFISCTGLLSSSCPSNMKLPFSFVPGLLPRLPVLHCRLIFLYLSFNFFNFCWPTDKTPFIPTIYDPFVLAFHLLWISCHPSTKILFRLWHLAIPLGLWILFPHYKKFLWHCIFPFPFSVCELYTFEHWQFFFGCVQFCQKSCCLS